MSEENGKKQTSMLDTEKPKDLFPDLFEGALDEIQLNVDDDIEDETISEGKEIAAPNTDPAELNFASIISLLKQELDYVEDGSFKWGDVMAVLVIQLKETDSKNKVRGESNATNVQLTDSIATEQGKSKTEDFFPSLVVNNTFSKWRLAVPSRMHKSNISKLKGEAEESGWLEDKIEIKRRPNLNAGRNPAIHICYLDNLDPLRDVLWPDDYLVLVKQKNRTIYEAFGLKSNVSLGDGKTLYVAPRGNNDQTTFVLNDLLIEPTYFIRVFTEEFIDGDLSFTINESDPKYEIGDEIWVFDPDSMAITYRIEVKGIDEGERKVNFRIKDKLEIPVTLEKLKEYGLSGESEQIMLTLIKGDSN